MGIHNISLFYAYCFTVPFHEKKNMFFFHYLFRCFTTLHHLQKDVKWWNKSSTMRQKRNYLSNYYCKYCSPFTHTHTHRVLYDRTHTECFMTGKGKRISWQPLLQTLGSAQHLWESSSEVSLGITDWDAVGTELEVFLKQSHIAFLLLPT